MGLTITNLPMLWSHIPNVATVSHASNAHFKVILVIIWAHVLAASRNASWDLSECFVQAVWCGSMPPKLAGKNRKCSGSEGFGCNLLFDFLGLRLSRKSSAVYWRQRVGP